MPLLFGKRGENAVALVGAVLVLVLVLVLWQGGEWVAHYVSNLSLVPEASHCP
jgi:hypothetical protein